MDFTPNYKEYTLKELLIAKQNVNKEKYPKKFAQIELAIYNRENAIEEIEVKQISEVHRGKTMRKRIKRLSPHQNGKVFGILICIATLPMFIPMLLMFSAMPSGTDTHFSSLMFFILPIFYLIFGYVSVAVMCLVYNVMQKFTGGFEFETTDVSSK